MWQTIDLLQSIKESFDCWRAAPTLYYIDTGVKAWPELDRVPINHLRKLVLLLYTTQRVNLHTPWFKVYSMCLFLEKVTLRIIQSLK